MVLERSTKTCLGIDFFGLNVDAAIHAGSLASPAHTQ